MNATSLTGPRMIANPMITRLSTAFARRPARGYRISSGSASPRSTCQSCRTAGVHVVDVSWRM